MNPHILIVDDPPSIRRMLEMTLKSADYQVTAAEDGQAALESCQEHQYHFVLTDQNMPKMDGITLVKSLRTIDDYKRTPIIILTTESSDSMKSHGREAGATGWMVKPFDPNKLLQVTAKVRG